MFPFVSATAELLSRLSVAVGVAAVVTVSLSVALGSAIVPGASPLTVAVLATLPAVTSVAVIVYVAVHVSVPFGASVAGCAGVQLSADRPGSGSLTDTFVRPTVPVFVARNV